MGRIVAALTLLAAVALLGCGQTIIYRCTLYQTPGGVIYDVCEP